MLEEGGEKFEWYWLSRKKVECWSGNTKNGAYFRIVWRSGSLWLDTAEVALQKERVYDLRKCFPFVMYCWTLILFQAFFHTMFSLGLFTCMSTLFLHLLFFKFLLSTAFRLLDRSHLLIKIRVFFPSFYAVLFIWSSCYCYCF